MDTEVRECICGREFKVVIEYAKPWTVCPDCQANERPPLELTSLDWWTFSRGQGVACRLLPEFPAVGTIPEDVLKNGDVVSIDGKRWVVRGVEYFMTNPPKLGNALSMWVEECPQSDVTKRKVNHHE